MTGAALLDQNFWKPLKPHREQHRFWTCEKRFEVVCAGRRSGKTDLAKGKLARRALPYHATHDGNFFFAGPTHAQAKKIYWDDVKRMFPRRFVRKVNETDLAVTLVTGVTVNVVGLDRPQRIEGVPGGIQGIVLDEVDEMKDGAWESSIRPALSTPGRPPGWAIFIGRPKGRRLLHKLYTAARHGTDPDWAGFHWSSEGIIDDTEIERARRDLDARIFAQEYGAEFVTFEGRIYYAFDAKIHAAERLPYLPEHPLMFCFDFNIKPGVAAVMQEQNYKGSNPRVAGEITASIGEVWIESDSTTPKVCRKLLEDWGHHKGDVLIYGDATGGAGGTAKVSGSDWELVKQVLRPHFGERLKFRVDDSNPPERVRINAVNSRLLDANGIAHWLLDSEKCPHLMDDFESVVAQDGSAGEIEKKKYPMLTHISDGAGYCAAKRHPITRHTTVMESV